MQRAYAFSEIGFVEIFYSELVVVVFFFVVSTCSEVPAGPFLAGISEGLEVMIIVSFLSEQEAKTATPINPVTEERMDLFIRSVVNEQRLSACDRDRKREFRPCRRLLCA